MEAGEDPPSAIEGDDGDDQITPLDYDIITSPVDYPLEELHRKMSDRELVMPAFHGQYTWDLPRASRLIESLAMDLPVPPVYVSERRDRAMLVIDGRHRLETIRRFFSEDLGGAKGGPVPQGFRLAGVNPEGRLSGKAFSDLDAVTRRQLLATLLRVVVIRQMEPDKNPAAIHHIFERLNTGGTQLRGQEARGCIYAGKLSGLLNTLNGIGEWRRLLGLPRPDGRQRDAELILRYMALFHNLAGYKNPMKDFLSSFMHANRDPTDEFVFEERGRFARTCALLLDRLGDGPFMRRGRINPSVFDAVFVTVAGSPDACGRGDLADRVRRLRSDREFVDYTTRATTDPLAVSGRMGIARAVLCGGAP